jgi:hypothetical protein
MKRNLFPLVCVVLGLTFGFGASSAYAGGCTGDATGDGVVDVFDILEVLGNWGECDPKGECSADLNDDGVVDVMDLLAVLEDLGCGLESCETHEDCDDGDECTRDYCFFGTCYHIPIPHCEG